MSDKIESVVRDATIVDVSTRQVGANNTTMWEVLTQDGTKWVTFQAGTGNKALALKGAKADLKVSIEKKGDFTNYYINGVQATAGGVQEAAAKAAAAAGEMTIGQFAGQQDKKEQEKNLSIHRQVATKVAATLLPSDSNEFWSNVKDLVIFYGTGETPTSGVTSHTASGTSSNATTTFTETVPVEDDIPF